LPLPNLAGVKRREREAACLPTLHQQPASRPASQPATTTDCHSPTWLVLKEEREKQPVCLPSTNSQPAGQPASQPPPLTATPQLGWC
ncbi:hypothetical protein SKAU_G00387310, partial [Synaphobranchus kaupii]